MQLLLLHRLLVLRRLLLVALRLLLDRYLVLRRLLLLQLFVYEQLLALLLCRADGRPNCWSRSPILAGPAILWVGRSTGPLQLVKGLLVSWGLLCRLVILLRLHLRGCCCHLHSARLLLPVPPILWLLCVPLGTGAVLHPRPLQRLLWLRRWLTLPLVLLQCNVPEAEALQICADCWRPSVTLLRGLAGWSELLPLCTALLMAAQCRRTAVVVLVLKWLLVRLETLLLQRRRAKSQALKVCIEVQCSCSGRLQPCPIDGRWRSVGTWQSAGCCIALRWPAKPRQRTATARCWAAGVSQRAVGRSRGQSSVKAGRGAAASLRIADHRVAGGQRGIESCCGCARALPQLASSPETVLCRRCCSIRVPHGRTLSLLWQHMSRLHRYSWCRVYNIRLRMSPLLALQT